MAQKATVEFKKGDNQTHYFKIPKTAWTPGGTLFFTAKPMVDNDPTDAAAVIDKTFTDADILESSHEEYDPNYVTYVLAYNASDIVNVTFKDGEKRKKYIGEFQFVDSEGRVTTYPRRANFLEVIIYADVKRGVA